MNKSAETIHLHDEEYLQDIDGVAAEDEMHQVIEADTHPEDGIENQLDVERHPEFENTAENVPDATIESPVGSLSDAANLEAVVNAHGEGAWEKSFDGNADREMMRFNTDEKVMEFVDESGEVKNTTELIRTTNSAEEVAKHEEMLQAWEQGSDQIFLSQHTYQEGEKSFVSVITISLGANSEIVSQTWTKEITKDEFEELQKEEPQVEHAGDDIEDDASGQSDEIVGSYADRSVGGAEAMAEQQVEAEIATVVDGTVEAVNNSNNVDHPVIAIDMTKALEGEAALMDEAGDTEAQMYDEGVHTAEQASQTKISRSEITHTRDTSQEQVISTLESFDDGDDDSVAEVAIQAKKTAAKGREFVSDEVATSENHDIGIDIVEVADIDASGGIEDVIISETVDQKGSFGGLEDISDRAPLEVYAEAASIEHSIDTTELGEDTDVALSNRAVILEHNVVVQDIQEQSRGSQPEIALSEQEVTKMIEKIQYVDDSRVEKSEEVFVESNETFIHEADVEARADLVQDTEEISITLQEVVHDVVDTKIAHQDIFVEETQSHVEVAIHEVEDRGIELVEVVEKDEMNIVENEVHREGQVAEQAVENIIHTAELQATDEVEVTTSLDSIEENVGIEIMNVIETDMNAADEIESTSQSYETIASTVENAEDESDSSVDFSIDQNSAKTVEIVDTHVEHDVGIDIVEFVSNEINNSDVDVPIPVQKIQAEDVAMVNKTTQIAASVPRIETSVDAHISQEDIGIEIMDVVDHAELSEMDAILQHEAVREVTTSVGERMITTVETSANNQVEEAAAQKEGESVEFAHKEERTDVQKNSSETNNVIDLTEYFVSRDVEKTADIPSVDSDTYIESSVQASDTDVSIKNTPVGVSRKDELFIQNLGSYSSFATPVDEIVAEQLREESSVMRQAA